MRDLEWTSQKLAQVFAPGREVLVLLPGRETFRRRALRQSLILGLHQEDLALTPPEPPLPAPLLGQALEVTVLAPEGKRHQRYAYRTNVLDVLDDFPAAPRGEAVVVMYPRQEDVYATSLRKARRYRVTPEAPARLLGPAGEAALLDISIKGLRCVWPGQPEDLAVGDPIQLTLVIHDEAFKINGRVAGLATLADRCELSVELGILALDAWASLQELIAKLEPLEKEQ
jgi:hypothetical protein